MPFKKLHPSLKEALERLLIESATPFQKKVIPKIKSGANVFGIAPKESGRTTAMIINTLHKLQCQSQGDAPRAIIIVENKKEAHELYDKFFAFTKYTDLRVYKGYEELHIDIQKSEIYMGIDILITTPKNIQKLFLTNGVSVSQLKIFFVDDADFLIQRKEITILTTTSESIKKCQYVVLAEKLSPRLDKLRDYFMENSVVVKI
ncbi:DEAD/DEAH box helicase [uncultured Maribacter sp.]|uniref:DEAD/DEAH box helicase n=1 Tax=uncultured Maribacter sp. TaxID=431308 RepID=UPI00263192FF|nr:DEAD/DEAH box helicase [uncultured Maribacter sp.]